MNGTLKDYSFDRESTLTRSIILVDNPNEFFHGVDESFPTNFLN